MSGTLIDTWDLTAQSPTTTVQLVGLTLGRTANIPGKNSVKPTENNTGKPVGRAREAEKGFLVTAGNSKV